jgi:hypothetical protein
MKRRFKITDESNQFGSCFVVHEWTLTGPILGYQWEWLVWCETREQAEAFIKATSSDFST